MPPRAGEAGFTLVEVLVATGILATAIVGAAGLLSVAAAAVESARSQTSATILATDKIEQLRALAWSDDRTGTPTSDFGTNLGVTPPAPGGTGLSPSPSDSLRRNAPGSVDYLDASGEWVGGGSSPPPGAVYVRRWQVAPLPDSPADTVVLQVVVMTVARAAVNAASGRVAPEAALVTVRTRKGAAW